MTDGVRGPAVEHAFVEGAGVRLHLARAGPGDGPPVLLLHGFPEFWYGWRRQIPALAEAGFRVWAPDGRGVNLSDRPAAVDDYRMDRLVADVVALIDATGRERACLVGHDWGGAVAWQTAIDHPERVARLAVLDAPHPAPFLRALRRDPRQQARSWYMGLFALPALPERLLALGGWRAAVRALRDGAPAGTFPDEVVARYREAWSRPGAMRAALDWYRAAARGGLAPARGAGRVTVPTRLIWGVRDRFLHPSLAEASVARCDGGDLVRLDAGHFVQHEAPERVNALLLEWFGAR